ncbi:MAG: efflux RND transporter periplasmic adaptor subunit [Niabella sp.]
MNKSFVAIFIALAAVAASCNSKNQNPQAAPPALPYPVVQVEMKDITGYQTYPTNLEGKINNAVRAKISGYIKQVFVDEGQVVKAGQPLFRLETNVLSQDANAAKSAITAAQAAVSAAQVEVDRLVPLVEKGIISNVQLETAKANLLRARGQSEQARASYNSVVASMDFSIVRSPISGVVGAINFREGSLVGPADQTPITTVSEIGQLYAYFAMNEREYFDFLAAHRGNTVKEKLSNLPAVDLILANGDIYPEKGKIQTVTGQINPQTGTIQFRAIFQNQNGLLNNGNSGTIRLPKRHPNALVIPQSATFERQGIVYVFRLDKDTAYTTPIEVLDQVNNYTVVKAGLNPGDKIIAQGTGKVRDKTRVLPNIVNMDSLVSSVKPVL